MPETGLFDEPTRPAMYADTELNRKPATIMMIVIGTRHGEVLHDRLIQPGERQREDDQRRSARPSSAGRVRFPRRPWRAPARVAASPLRMPDSSDLRSEISVQMPPTSIAPTPR